MGGPHWSGTALLSEILQDQRDLETRGLLQHQTIEFTELNTEKKDVWSGIGCLAGYDRGAKML